MDEEDPPYQAEYAKSSRAMCKSCQSHIAKDSLRIALMVQSRHFDGKQPNWYHYTCFFGKCHPQSVNEIGKFHNLRWEDQEKIRLQVERKGSGSGNGKSGSGTKLIAKSLKDFVVQYALSSRSTCKKCDIKIEKDEIRISHKEIDPEKPQLGPIDRWHHVGCFVKRRKEFGWKDNEYSADMLTGFKALDADDRKTLTKLLTKKKKGKKATANAVECDGVKQETNGTSSEADVITAKLRQQSSTLWKVIDTLKKADLKKPELTSILEKNEQVVPKGLDKILERIADGMTFGRLAPCSQCGGQLVASSRGFYRCVGNISGWTSCTNTTLDVKRSAWAIPAELKEECSYLKNYKYKARDRIFPPPPAPRPLANRKILLQGKLSRTKEELKVTIEKMGGTVTSSMAKAHCCISTADEVAAGKKRIKDAEVQDLFIVSEDFLKECEQIKTPTNSLLPLLQKFNLADWGSERTITDAKSMKRMLEEESRSGMSSKKMKVVVKSGAAVDPESNLEDDSEVLQYHGRMYTATLAMVDMKSGSNSYYKLQVLAKNSGRTWHVFRSWGRVGTSIGGTKLEAFRSVDHAVQNFNELYFEKTGNEFGSKHFEKLPRKFYPLDIDYFADDVKVQSLDGAGSKSKLPVPVQEVVKMIFDIESMKRAMLEFELDLNKMPLGKLSKKQMQTAYSVLTEANELIKTGKLSGGKMLDCSNRFYTLIPHDYGMHQPPPLDNADIIKAKTEMLDNLMDIEVACNLLKGSESSSTEEDPLDASYAKLQCGLEIVDKDSDEFEMVRKYLDLTHAKTHNQYTLTIEQLFRTDRQGEAARFRPFQSLPNRKLLWHGSRVTNYAGILSQGLRIAPPEAPVTGYMFGKGIYFADMASKSANYCATSSANPDGLLLLADVALGNMYELTEAKNVRKLPKRKHSVKGIGRTEPDKQTYEKTADQVEVPVGKGVEADLGEHGGETTLLYNEYIVYDAAQVKLKYLVKVKFNYQSLW